MGATAVLFLDLDGTVRHGRAELGRFVNTPQDVVVFPQAVARMREWKASGGRIVTVTNQGGVALGFLAPDVCQAALLRTMELAEHLVDVSMMCPHHPSAADPEVASCWCRKPSPGLIFDGLRELQALHPEEFYPSELAVFVGDRPEDEQCAQRAGIRFVSADQWRTTVCRA